MEDQILIGTSGFDYPEWKGVFYPPELKRSDFLAYYSTQFNGLEVNNTFYNMPDDDRMRSFVKRSEGRLHFSVKANRLLTHEVSADWRKAADEFKMALSPMQDRGLLSAVLFQLPQGFRYTKDNRLYLAELLQAFQGYPATVEFRHAEWIRDSVFTGLAERNVPVVFCDMPELKSLPNGASFSSAYSRFAGSSFYLRLHGRNKSAWYVHDSSKNGSSRYEYEYSDEELQEFVPVIKEASKGGRKVQVFFNNHPNGSGAGNAKKLKEYLKHE